MADLHIPYQYKQAYDKRVAKNDPEVLELKRIKEQGQMDPEQFKIKAIQVLRNKKRPAESYRENIQSGQNDNGQSGEKSNLFNVKKPEYSYDKYKYWQEQLKRDRKYWQIVNNTANATERNRAFDKKKYPYVIHIENDWESTDLPITEERFNEIMKNLQRACEILVQKQIDIKELEKRLREQNGGNLTPKQW